MRDQNGKDQVKKSSLQVDLTEAGTQPGTAPPHHAKTARVGDPGLCHTILVTVRILVARGVFSTVSKLET